MLKFSKLFARTSFAFTALIYHVRTQKNTMANLDQAPSRTMPNLLHVLPAFANESEHRVNTIVELNSNTINKYELITETGHLKRSS